MLYTLQEYQPLRNMAHGLRDLWSSKLVLKIVGKLVKKYIEGNRVGVALEMDQNHFHWKLPTTLWFL